MKIIKMPGKPVKSQVFALILCKISKKPVISLVFWQKWMPNLQKTSEITGFLLILHKINAKTSDFTGFPGILMIFTGFYMCFHWFYWFFNDFPQFKWKLYIFYGKSYKTSDFICFFKIRHSFLSKNKWKQLYLHYFYAKSVKNRWFHCFVCKNECRIFKKLVKSQVLHDFP